MGPEVRVELLSAPGCPNVEAARTVVEDCLAEAGLDIALVERVGGYRSPTVLVDGVDVMGASADEVVGDACRLDLPTHARVLEALRGAPISPLTMDSLRDSDRDGTSARVAALPAPLRQAHRAVLRAFVATGRAPHVDELRHEIGASCNDRLRELAQADLVHVGPDGRVTAAYPFSGTATGHTVRLGSGVTVEAMCAIDALGIPLMTGQDAMITSIDPESGDAVHVERRGDVWSWTPSTTVVALAQSSPRGPAVTCLCPTIAFHSTRSNADTYLKNHPELRAVVLTQDEALDVAARSFGNLEFR